MSNLAFTAQVFAPAFDFERSDRVALSHQFGVEQFEHPLGIRPSGVQRRELKFPKVGAAVGGAIGATGGPISALQGGVIGSAVDLFRQAKASDQDYDRQSEIENRLRQNNRMDGYGAEDAQLPDFLREPFEGDETGPEVWTDRDKHKADLLERLHQSGYGGPELDEDLDALLAKHDNLVDRGQLDSRSPYGYDAENKVPYIPPRR